MAITPIVSQIVSPNLQNQILTDQDSSFVENITLTGVFDTEKDVIHAYLYTTENEFQDRLTTNYTTLLSRVKGTTVSSLELDPVKDLESNFYNTGIWKIDYNFLSPIQSGNLELYISEISLDRTELRLDSIQKTPEDLDYVVNSIREKTQSNSFFEGTYLDLGLGQLNLITNSTLDKDTLLVKLYRPLPNTFSIKNRVNIYYKISDPIAYQVEFPVEEVEIDDLIYVKGPNFHINLGEKVNNSTNYTSLQTLATASSTSLINQLNSFLQENRAELNTDYTDYSNFIHFSSAETRLNNFYTKVALIEDYTNVLSTLDSITNSTETDISASKAFYEGGINNMITNFDSYEYYLYYESSSYTWPKSNSTKPYTLYPTGSTEVSNWMAEQIVTASFYDESNADYIYNLIPNYLTQDSSNDKLRLFLEMTGQMFDEIWLYTNAIKNRQDGDNSITGGISIDLVADALRSYGIELYESSFSNSDLYTTLLGVTQNGLTVPPTGSELITTYISASAETTPFNDAQKLIYKRLYHNLPLLLKKKGTISGLRVLLNCFGIPDTTVRISEFGGKDKNQNTWDYNYNQFNYTYKTNGSEYITTPWLGTPFISVWQPTSPIELPLIPSGEYDMIVEWGDGTYDSITAWDDAAKTHNYADNRNYVVTITGTCKGFAFNNEGYKTSILDVLEWGSLELTTSASFYGASNLGSITLAGGNLPLTAIDFPTISTTSFKRMFSDANSFSGSINNWNTSTVTDMSYTFAGCDYFNTSIDDWNVSNVTTMNSMFGNFDESTTSNFNQPLSSWDTGNVIDMTQMFATAADFNQDIGGWNVASAQTMSYMFYGAENFNNGGSNSINTWDTSAVTSMLGMFKGCSNFNQNIQNWNVSNVTTMQSMFENCTIFDQPLDSWNTVNLTNTSYMFSNATSFDKPLNGWDTSALTNTSNMFNGATSFNKDLTNWDMSNVTLMNGMFNGATSFNNEGMSTIDSWVFPAVTDISYLFYGASAFNQPIGPWNTQAIVNMVSTFENATSFNQNLSTWDFRNVIDMTNFISNSGMDTGNYDALLNKIATQATTVGVQIGVTLSAINIYRTAASSAAYTTLTNAPYNWTILDAGIR